MNVLDTLGVNSLSLRGLNEQFNTFERLFQSKADALQAVAENDYVPTPGKLNTVLIAGEPNAIWFWSFDLLDFVNIADFQSAGNQAEKYIDLDGVNDYIEFTGLANGAEAVLDFTNDFTIGVTFVGLQTGSDNLKMDLFSNGKTHITLSRGGSNWGLYVTSNDDLYDATTRAQANTWVAPGELDRVLFVYTVADKRLKYYLGDQGNGTFAMKANLSIPQSMIDAQAPDGKLSMAKGFDGPGGATFDGTPWDGGVDNLIVSDMAFTGPHLVEYFQSGSEFTQMALYADLKGYAKLGEDTYPNIVDLKGNMTGGELHNGTAQDFKDIPTE